MALVKYKDPATGEWHSASGGGTAGGVDVTAEVGQTIVVEEVDANGKPTAWKATDFPVEAKFYTVEELQRMTMGELAAEFEKHPIIVRVYADSQAYSSWVSVLLSYDGYMFGGIGIGREGAAAHIRVYEEVPSYPVSVDQTVVYIPTFLKSNGSSSGFVKFTGQGFITEQVVVDSGAFMTVDITQLTDGAVITIDLEEYRFALNRYQTTASLALMGMETSGNLCIIPVLYISTNEAFYPVVAKFLSPTTGDIITVTLVPEF